jgi:DNA-binding response OmpR family regulator
MKRPTILIVDSDEPSRILLEEMIHMMFQESSKYQILATSYGNEAISMCNENNIRLILTEINLKDVNGLDVAKKIKESHPEIPVIIQTAIITDDIQNHVNLSSADSYLLKPLDLYVLSNKIKEVLDTSPSNY